MFHRHVYSSSKNFGKDTFNFISTLWNYLIDSLFCHIVNIFCGPFNRTQHNFSCLVNHISICICKVIAVPKASRLPFSFSRYNFSFPFLLFFRWVHGVETLNFQVHQQKNSTVVLCLFQYYFQKICLIFLSINGVFYEKLINFVTSKF